MANALTAGAQALMDAYWRAANYLSVGQIYLYDNPLLRKPLTKEHIKPRLLGHWGTTPGLNFVYVHLNRMIKTSSWSTRSTSRATATTCPRSRAGGGGRRPRRKPSARRRPTTSERHSVSVGVTR